MYAKLETIRKMGEGLARIAVVSMVWAGRWSDPERLDQDIAESRSELVKVLSDLGTPQPQIKSIVSRLDSTIAADRGRSGR